MTADRELCYSDRFTDYLVNEISENTSGDSIDNELALNLTERQFLILEVTGKEYTELFSSVLTGADLLFTDKSHQVTWLLWKAAKMETLCEAVAACILSSTATQEALQKTLTDGGYTGGVGNPNAGVSQAVLDENWLDGIACDNDALWGSCQHVVDGIFDATTEVLQRVELAGNAIEQISEVLDAIPIVGGILSLAVQVVSWSLEQAYDIWVVVDSQAVRDEVACALFCNTQDACAITMQDVVTTFAEEAQSAPPAGSSYKANLEWLFGLDIVSSPPLVAAAAIAHLGVLTLKFGGRVGQSLIGIHSLQQLAAMGAIEYPNPGWAVLCACGWEETWLDPELGTDWITNVSVEGAVPIGAYGLSLTWPPAIGWGAEVKTASPGLQVTALGLSMIVPSGVQLTSVEVVYNLNNSGIWSGSNPGQIVFLSSPGLLLIDVDCPTDPPGTDKLLSWSGNATTLIADTMIVKMYSGREYTANPIKRGDLLIKSITLRGSGANPFL